MNWKEFKDSVEAQGVKDDTVLDWIADMLFDGLTSVGVAIGDNGKAAIMEDWSVTVQPEQSVAE